ncbi:MAG: amidohydrolase family protein [Pyrinomonadaceae bacterium]
MKILSAKHVLPISAEPIVNGAVVIDGGRIVFVGDLADAVAKFPSAEVEDFGDAAILPGFVNCHSHIELTSMRGALDSVEHDFTSWLLRINELRSALTDADIEAAAIAGALEGAAAGVTCFGDIGRYGTAGVRALKQVGLRGIVYQETEFSPDNRTADEDFTKLGTKFEELKNEETDLVRIGISPHSPYTVSSRLFELIAQYSILNRVPLTIHAAESKDEMALLTKGEGFFTTVYDRFGLEWQSPLCSPIEYLEKLGVLSARPLLAHCVHVSETDIQRIASNGATIAHCPKSNAKFGHGWAPFEKFLGAGISVGLGSDSVASNNICDILEESRFAVLAARNRVDCGSPHEVRANASRSFITAKQALETATLGGAKALGLDHLIGTLEPRKQADIAVVSLDHQAQQPVTDIEAALIFSSNGRDVQTTIVAGNCIYQRPA